MDTVKLFEMLGLEDFKKKNPFVFNFLVIFLIIISLFLILWKPVKEIYTDYFKKEPLFNVTIKLQTSDGKPAKPFANSWLSMGLNSEELRWDTIINTEGYAHFTNQIQSKYKNKEVLIATESDQFLLANPTRLYGLSLIHI